MKRIKSNLALVALLLGSGAAFAFAAPAPARPLSLYAYDSTAGQWNQTAIDPAKEGINWQCSGGTGVCTAYFSSKPALHATPPSGYEPGVFSTIP
jgi:hypothetical protein